MGRRSLRTHLSYGSVAIKSRARSLIEVRTIGNRIQPNIYLNIVTVTTKLTSLFSPTSAKLERKECSDSR
ncbi:unnamed protein product [Periconia digitata]|uniref:Uncharacterized protein n=1 Tax=Periconia digitata TaxID=1303443 RepID=A0A9W4UHE2_9PLEO|nr:unnamed protein product [Periconia digitata]